MISLWTYKLAQPIEVFVLELALMIAEGALHDRILPVKGENGLDVA